MHYRLANNRLFPLPGLQIDGKDAKGCAAMEAALAAAAAYESGDYGAAIACYSTAIEDYPEQPFFYACRSLLNRQLGDEEGAFYDYQVAKNLDFNYHHFMEWRANEGEMLESDELLELNEQLDNGSSAHQLYVNRAMLHVQHYCYLEAVEDFSKAYALKNDAAYLISSAAVYMRMLEYDNALVHLTKVIDDKKDSFPDAYLYRGKLYAAIYENDLAERDLNFCIAQSPTNKLYYEERAGFQERSGDLAKAIMDYGRLVELDPEDFFPYVMRADLYEKTDDVRAAIADYDKAILLNPYYSDLYQYRAGLREKIGDKTGAAQDMERYEELENED